MNRFWLLVLIPLFTLGQQSTKVNFISCHALVKPNAIEKSIEGTLIYKFKVAEVIDTLRIDAVNMNFQNLLINNKSVNFKVTKKQLLLFEGYKLGQNTVSFSYKAIPKQTLYFTGDWKNSTSKSGQIWTQGQGKYTSHWFPSFDDVNEKVIFNISVQMNENDVVLSNGILKKHNDKTHVWTYSMQKPMSSYLLMLAVGNYAKQSCKSKTGVVLEFYLDKKDTLKFEPTYRYSKQIFDFFEHQIGVKYPWQIYRQVPVRDFLYAGMENTTSTIFSQDFVVDSIGFNDKSYVNVNAHELAHQWFGNLITANKSKHHWLHEGFATYYALWAEQKIYGVDYFNRKLNEYALELKANLKYDSIPILNEKASSLTFYKKGACALHVLRTNVGDDAFKKAVQNYLNTYAFKNVDTDDFLNEIKKVSSYDVALFKKRWLESADFNWDEFQTLISSSTSNLSAYTNNTDDLTEDFLEIMKGEAYFGLKQDVLYQIEAISFENKQQIIKAALATNNIKIRQTVAETTNKIPTKFRVAFESLLDDDSYITREITLYKLFANFPSERKKYLDLSKNWEGLNFNLKLAHLTMLFVYNKNYNINNQLVIKELLEFTKVSFDVVTRQKAIEILIDFNIITDNVLQSLLSLTNHYKWQTVRFAKDTLKSLSKSEDLKSRIDNMILLNK
ncbi:M1 family metallopeptidase [uncultured Flavobacterium sp.]|uniref:M1 family metallopeptidase n=1 Tax=uncultured Flavobacterium sp. TaxID=165435 RepID=UPI0030CA519B